MTYRNLRHPVTHGPHDGCFHDSPTGPRRPERAPQRAVARPPARRHARRSNHASRCATSGSWASWKPPPTTAPTRGRRGNSSPVRSATRCCRHWPREVVDGVAQVQLLGSRWAGRWPGPRSPGRSGPSRSSAPRSLPSRSPGCPAAASRTGYRGSGRVRLVGAMPQPREQLPSPSLAGIPNAGGRSPLDQSASAEPRVNG
jgi:hypothetical protein